MCSFGFEIFCRIDVSVLWFMAVVVTSVMHSLVLPRVVFWDLFFSSYIPLTRCLCPVIFGIGGMLLAIACSARFLIELIILSGFSFQSVLFPVVLLALAWIEMPIPLRRLDIGRINFVFRLFLRWPPCVRVIWRISNLGLTFLFVVDPLLYAHPSFYFP